MNEKALDKQVGGDHYKKMKIQPLEYCQKNELNVCESFVVKYVSRHRFKNGRQDIEKAIHCLQVLLQIEYPVDEKKTKTQLVYGASENTMRQVIANKEEELKEDCCYICKRIEYNKSTIEVLDGEGPRCIECTCYLMQRVRRTHAEIKHLVLEELKKEDSNPAESGLKVCNICEFSTNEELLMSVFGYSCKECRREIKENPNYTITDIRHLVMERHSQ